MSPDTLGRSADAHELMLTRLVHAPRAKVWRAWTDPSWLTQWFAPLPYTTPRAVLDVRVGGTSAVTMRSPEGVETVHRGVYLEVVEPERLVFTDAYVSAWVPSAKPFMTVVLSFDAEGGHTRYTARARHWSQSDCERHASMGFQQGWGLATDQLAALVEK